MDKTLKVLSLFAFLLASDAYGQQTYNKFHHGLPDERIPRFEVPKPVVLGIPLPEDDELIRPEDVPDLDIPNRQRKPRHTLMAQTMQQAVIMSPQPSSGGGPTITVTSAVCVNNTSTTTNTISCTLLASGAVGDLLVLKSKVGFVGGTQAPTWTFSGTSSCTPTTVVAAITQSNGGGPFVETISGCIITTAGANTPVITWTVGSFVDIEAFTVHTTTSWKTTFVDQVQTSIATATGVTCPTGTTTATTTANDFILATCDVFNAGQTWGALTGFTQYAAASRNTAGAYYKVVTSTGTQSTTIPLSATDFGLGVIVAFASN